MEPRRKKRRRKGTVEAASFMDTVHAAFIRWLALEKWRELDDLRTTLGMELEQAIGEAGRFPNRERYEPLWIECWKAGVRAEKTGADAGSLFGAIEEAVAAAVEAEAAERKARGDGALEEDREYKSFVDTALERLLREGDLGVSS
jgi:hypothetical protein